MLGSYEEQAICLHTCSVAQVINVDEQIQRLCFPISWCLYLGNWIATGQPSTDVECTGTKESPLNIRDIDVGGENKSCLKFWRVQMR